MSAATIRFPHVFPRPKSQTGIWSWITTVDHKRIGIMYAGVSLFWFLVGGVEALLLREQLRVAENTFLGPETYNQLFTMHGTTMVFLVGMPLAAAFFNLLVPLHIGARDVAFPRLNSLSLWTFVFGSIFLNISWLTGEAPNGGWFGYAPNTGRLYNPGLGMTYWVLGLNVLGIASIAAGLNFIVTIVNMRAPGMTLFRMPIFVWMALITSVLIILALPILTVALIQLQSDRLYGTNFYNPAAGGDPVLWQHMFWLFGHPEVYILILPGMGIVSEIIPTFSRKPIFGYPFIVFAGIAIAFLGWFVWGHHMFTVGLGPAANTAFTISSMAIGIPTGIKIFNWIGTMYGGSIRFTTPMLFAISFIAMFTIGGISGVMHAAVPSDAQQQDTYFVVAHFHYVLFGGLIMAIFGGIVFWWPKFFGWMLNDRVGKIAWGLMFVGFNLQFAPLHWLGLDGMPRRIYTYSEELGWSNLNTIASIGGFIIAISVLVFLFNIWYSYRRREPAGNDPWDGRTLEWSTPSPIPPHNFDEIPVVERLDHFWYTKYPELLHDDAKPNSDKTKPSDMQPSPSGGSIDLERENTDKPGSGLHSKIHLPDMSYYPLLVAAGIVITAGGLLMGQVTPAAVYSVVLAIGGVSIIWGTLGWSFEPATDHPPEDGAAH